MIRLLKRLFKKLPKLPSRGQITPNFHVNEFHSPVDNYPTHWIEERLTPLCKALEVIRFEWGRPVNITSAYRDPIYNKTVGGVKKSQHIEGRAVDIQIRGVSPKDLGLRILELMDKGEIPKGGIGIYDNFVHYDIRGRKTRWGFKKE